MRLFVLTLALYIAALSLVTCQDEAPRPFASDRESPSATEHRPGASHHEDDCTPLCTCSCCGVQTVSPPAAIADLAEPLDLPPTGRTRPHHVPSWKGSPAADSAPRPPRA